MKMNKYLIPSIFFCAISLLSANETASHTINITEFENKKNDITLDGSDKNIIVSISETNGKNKIFRKFKVADSSPSTLLDANVNLNPDISINRTSAGSVLVTNNTNDSVAYKFQKENGGYILIDVPAHQTTGGGVILEKKLHDLNSHSQVWSEAYTISGKIKQLTEVPGKGGWYITNTSGIPTTGTYTFVISDKVGNKITYSDPFSIAGSGATKDQIQGFMAATYFYKGSYNYIVEMTINPVLGQPQRYAYDNTKYIIVS